MLAFTGWRRGWAETWLGIALALVLLLLAVWAGGVWLMPLGPMLWGGHWLSFLLVGFFVVLVLAALMPSRPVRTSAADSAGPLFGVLFVVAVVALAGAIVLKYVC